MPSTEFGLTPIPKEKFHFLPVYLQEYLLSGRGLEDFQPEKLEQYYLYTGRGPSNGSFHLGHLPGLFLALELTKLVDGRLFFMLSDDEKIFRDKINLPEMAQNVKMTLENLQKIGFNEKNTQFHINSRDFGPEIYRIIMQLMSCSNLNQLQGLMGPGKNIGEYFYTFYQIAPCFLEPQKTCLVIAGVDQDPYFRFARDLAERLRLPKPIILYTETIPGLDGSPKMTTSNPNSLPIFITDTESEINAKVKKIRQVGAGGLDELFENGANLEEDVPFRLIRFFEPDRKKTQLLQKAYTVGLVDVEEQERITRLFGGLAVKCLKVRENRMMVTTFGIRNYLTSVITILFGHSPIASGMSVQPSDPYPEIIVKTHNLSEVLTNNRIEYNVNNRWREEGLDRPDDYDQVLSQSRTKNWIDRFHQGRYATMEFRKDDVGWFFDAMKVGCQTGKFSSLFQEELETTADRYRDAFRVAKQKVIDRYSESIYHHPEKEGVFIRSERVSLKYGEKGPGPYFTIEEVIKSIVSSIRGHEVFTEDESTFRLYLLPWLEMSSDDEYRVFVYKGQITAISQQNLYQVNDHLCKMDDERIIGMVKELINYFKKEIHAKMNWIESYVMDLAWVRLTNGNLIPYFIEPNSFGTDYASGSALFHWTKDHEMLHDPKKIEFRYVNVDEDT